MARENYAAQVALLVRILPYVAKEEIFTLQGGTAINLFYRDLPRLSVDIDLTYLPVKDRAESLVEINDAMDRIAAAIESGITVFTNGFLRSLFTSASGTLPVGASIW